MRNFLSRIPFHPILFAAYPALALIAWNVREVGFLIGLRSLLSSIVLVGLFFLIAGLLLRHWQSAALVSSLFVMLFFSYGRVHQFLADQGLTLFAYHKVTASLYFLLFITGAFFIIRKMKVYSDPTMIFNVVSIILVIFPLFTIGEMYIPAYLSENDKAHSNDRLDAPTSILPLDTQDQSLKIVTNPPDIYFIILDSYTRADYLLEDYAMDNSVFLNELTDLGFQVADCARSNYDGTRLSLSATLNMEFVQDLSQEFNPTNTNIYSIEPYLKRNKVFHILRNLGYRIVAAQTIFPVTSFTSADVYIPFQEKSDWWNRSLNEFEDIFINSTILKATRSIPGEAFKEFRDKIRFPYYDYVRQINFLIDEIPGIANINGPKMVFLHITIPHRPYIFLPDGSFTTEEEFSNMSGLPMDHEHANLGYRNNVEFINMRILPQIKSIIQQSEGNVIIALQGDHGFWGRNRSAILNAIYLTGDSQITLPENMTPINTFRVIFNQYFNGEYEYLDDHSYNTEIETPFLLKEQEEESPYCLP